MNHDLVHAMIQYVHPIERMGSVALVCSMWNRAVASFHWNGSMWHIDCIKKFIKFNQSIPSSWNKIDQCKTKRIVGFVEHLMMKIVVLDDIDDSKLLLVSDWFKWVNFIDDVTTAKDIHYGSGFLLNDGTCLIVLIHNDGKNATLINIDSNLSTVASVMELDQFVPDMGESYQMDFSVLTSLAPMWRMVLYKKKLHRSLMNQLEGAKRTGFRMHRSSTSYDDNFRETIGQGFDSWTARTESFKIEIQFDDYYWKISIKHGSDLLTTLNVSSYNPPLISSISEVRLKSGSRCFVIKLIQHEARYPHNLQFSSLLCNESNEIAFYPYGHVVADRNDSSKLYNCEHMIDQSLLRFVKVHKFKHPKFAGLVPK